MARERSRRVVFMGVFRMTARRNLAERDRKQRKGGRHAPPSVFQRGEKTLVFDAGDHDVAIRVGESGVNKMRRARASTAPPM